MLVVRLEMHHSRTGRVSELGRMTIANDGSSTDPALGHFDVHLVGNLRERRDRIENFPRLRLNAWRLVGLALELIRP